MDATFKTWKTSRKLFLEYFDNYSLKQLNTTPKGFNNNLIWNMGHIVVSQQSLIYSLSNLETDLPEDLTNSFKSGTKPTRDITSNEVNTIKEFMFQHVERTESDFDKGVFKTYKEVTIGIGFHLTNIEEALQFNNYHEAVHLGFMFNIKKFI